MSSGKDVESPFGYISIVSSPSGSKISDVGLLIQTLQPYLL